MIYYELDNKQIINKRRERAEKMVRERKKRKYPAVYLILFMALLPGISALRVQASVEKKKVVVGTNAEYAPFDYLDSDGNLTGFDIDLLEAVAEETDLELVWRDLPFDSLLGAMEAGDVEVIAAAVGPTEEREHTWISFAERLRYYS